MVEMIKVQEKHRFDEKKVENYLLKHLEGFRGPLRVEQFSFGQSNPTYRLESASGRYVMRRKPPGKLLPSAHAVDREFRAISAVGAQGLPVPQTLLLCQDESIAGTIFYVMEYKEGRVFADRNLDHLSVEDRSAMIDDFIRVLAQLHSIDHEACGLADFGRPGNYFARQISRWSKQYRASETNNIPEMNRLMAWLPDNIPEDDRACLVHGDYSLHNIMYHPTEPRIVAVLDWELSTVGHPLGDLFYAAMPWYSPGESYVNLSAAEREERRIPDLLGLLSRYVELSGYGATVEHQNFYKAYTLFRLGAILQGIVGRVRDGTASNRHAADMAAQVYPLAKAACHQIDTA